MKYCKLLLLIFFLIAEANAAPTAMEKILREHVKIDLTAPSKREKFPDQLDEYDISHQLDEEHYIVRFWEYVDKPNFRIPMKMSPHLSIETEKYIFSVYTKRENFVGFNDLRTEINYYKHHHNLRSRTMKAPKVDIEKMNQIIEEIGGCDKAKKERFSSNESALFSFQYRQGCSPNEGGNCTTLTLEVLNSVPGDVRFQDYDHPNYKTWKNYLIYGGALTLGVCSFGGRKLAPMTIAAVGGFVSLGALAYDISCACLEPTNKKDVIFFNVVNPSWAYKAIPDGHEIVQERIFKKGYVEDAVN